VAISKFVTAVATAAVAVLFGETVVTETEDVEDAEVTEGCRGKKEARVRCLGGPVAGISLDLFFLSCASSPPAAARVSGEPTSFSVCSSSLCSFLRLLLSISLCNWLVEPLAHASDWCRRETAENILLIEETGGLLLRPACSDLGEGAFKFFKVSCWFGLVISSLFCF